MKINKNKKELFIFLIILLSLITIVYFINKYISGIYLTQLCNNTPSQMMGYLIKTKNSKTIAIDGGYFGDTDNFIKVLNEKYGGKVDYWFITHPHQDHASVFIDIVQNHPEIEIGNVYYTINGLDWYKKYGSGRDEEAVRFFEALSNERIKNNLHEVSINEKIKIDNIKCEILGIKNPEITENAINNSSMVIKMKVNNKSVLFLGDTGKESGEKLLKNQKDKLKSDVVQMAHHGQSGADKDLYEVIRPKICLWPTPDWLWNNDSGGGFNTGNWKTLETREWMNSLNVKINYIEKDGNISIKIW